jgi:ubiquinone biosynthesis protein UbiJ
MDIDWSEPLAGLVGDGLAYQLQQTGSKLGRWGKQSVRSVSASFSEYLQEESRDVVTETELEIFNEDVDRLRNDVDRLQAKIDLIIGSRLKSEE